MLNDEEWFHSNREPRLTGVVSHGGPGEVRHVGGDDGRLKEAGPRLGWIVQTRIVPVMLCKTGTS